MRWGADVYVVSAFLRYFRAVTDYLLGLIPARSKVALTLVRAMMGGSQASKSHLSHTLILFSVRVLWVLFSYVCINYP